MSVAAPANTLFPGAIRAHGALPRAIARGLRRRPAVFLAAVALLAAPALVYLGTGRVAQSAAPTPADLFIRSVVTRDGELGWQQLCPTVQAQLPLALVVQQAEAQRAGEAGLGLTLTPDYVGAHRQPNGGEIRFYVVTAHLSDGALDQRTYVVHTQANGCVDEVE